MQPASAISAIRFGYGYFGAIMAAVCLLLVFMLNIDKNIDKIQADLQAKHNA